MTKGRPNILFILLDDLRDEGVMDVAEVLPKTKQWLPGRRHHVHPGLHHHAAVLPGAGHDLERPVPHNHGVFDNHRATTSTGTGSFPATCTTPATRTGLVGKFITDWNFRYEPPHFDAYAVFQGGYTDRRSW